MIDGIYSFASVRPSVLSVIGGLKYLRTEHLGNMVGVKDAACSLLSQQRAMPFEEMRGDVGGITQPILGIRDSVIHPKSA